MKEAANAVAADLNQNNDKFASAVTLNSSYIDQPLVAALRTGTWEQKIRVLNPEGVKTNFGIYHIAPPKSNRDLYKERKEGELLLIQQQELVEENKSRLAAKTTDLYSQGRMANIADFFGRENGRSEPFR